MLRRLLRHLLTPLLSLLLIALLPASAQAQNDDKTMLWTIEKDGTPVGHLVGSIHYMTPSAYPLDSAYARAFATSDVVAFETNLDSAKAQAQTLIRRLGTYPQGQTLQGGLPDSTYALLQRRADSLGMPLSRLRRFEPWTVSMMMSSAQMQKAGYKGTSGIDVHFFERARQAQMPRVRFETPAEQFRLFDAFSAQQQERFLRYSLQNADRTVQMMDEMAAAWTRGDAERIEAIVQDRMQQRFPSLYQTLIVERNRLWMSSITDLLSGPRMPFIVVGAGHLLGDDGLVTLLRERGYTVRQQ